MGYRMYANDAKKARKGKMLPEGVEGEGKSNRQSAVGSCWTQRTEDSLAGGTSVVSTAVK